MAGFAFNSLPPEIRDDVLGNVIEHLQEEARHDEFGPGMQQGFAALVHVLREAQSYRAPLIVKKSKAKQSDDAEPSERGVAFAVWFAGQIPPHLSPDKARARKWARWFDAEVASGKTEAEIAKVCQWARGHAFWAQHFFSPLKLSEKRDGVSYWDKFQAGMNPQAAARAQKTSREHGLGEVKKQTVERL